MKPARVRSNLPPDPSQPGVVVVRTAAPRDRRQHQLDCAWLSERARARITRRSA